MTLASAWAPILLAGLIACGGEEPPPAGTPAERPGAGRAAGAAAQARAGDTAGPADSEVQLMRETFSYRGGGRDPFESLLRSGAVRPLLEDLRVTTITYNHQYPSNSVAVLRDMAENKTYTVRVGDQLGRLRVARIREEEVVVVFDEFGVERQEVLRLRRRGQEDL